MLWLDIVRLNIAATFTIFFTHVRYCINSSSLNFHPAEKTGDDDTDGKPHEILKHTATIQGCGADGFCTLKGRQDAMKKKMENLKVSPEKDEVKQDR